MQKEIQKKFFVLDIIPSELVALNCLYYSSTINVLANSLRILCITKTDFFECIYLHSD